MPNDPKIDNPNPNPRTTRLPAEKARRFRELSRAGAGSGGGAAAEGAGSSENQTGIGILRARAYTGAYKPRTRVNDVKAAAATAAEVAGGGAAAEGAGAEGVSLGGAVAKDEQKTRENRCVEEVQSRLLNTKDEAEIKSLNQFIKLIKDEDVDLKNNSDLDMARLLAWAAYFGVLKVVNKLLEYQPKIDLNKTLVNRCTALYYAVEKGHHDVVDALLQAGADPNIASTRDNVVPLDLAASQGDLECVKVFCKFSNIKNFINSKALYLAARSGKLDIVNFLLQEGADPHQKSQDGIPVLHFAASAGHHDVVDALLKAGVYPNSKAMVGAIVGVPALEWAVQTWPGKTDKMIIETVNVLIKGGASLTRGAYILDYIRESKNQEQVIRPLEKLYKQHSRFDAVLNNTLDPENITKLVTSEKLHPNYYSGVHTPLTAYLLSTDPNKMDNHVVKKLITPISIIKKTGGLLRRDPLTILLGKRQLNMEVAMELAESLKKSGYSLDPYLDLTTPSAREFAKQYKTINNSPTWVAAVGIGGGGSKGNGGPAL